MDTSRIVKRTAAQVRALPRRNVPTVRAIRKALSVELRGATAREVVAVGQGLAGFLPRWLGYEIIAKHRPALASLRKAFDVEHQGQFGHTAPHEPVEVVSYRVRGIGLVPAVAMPKFSPHGGNASDALRERRRVAFDGAALDCPVYQRERLDVGVRLRGPAILDQFDCTTVICAGQTARVDDWKNLIVTVEK